MCTLKPNRANPGFYWIEIFLRNVKLTIPHTKWQTENQHTTKYTTKYTPLGVVVALISRKSWRHISLFFSKTPEPILLTFADRSFNNHHHHMRLESRLASSELHCHPCQFNIETSKMPISIACCAELILRRVNKRAVGMGSLPSWAHVKHTMLVKTTQLHQRHRRAAGRAGETTFDVVIIAARCPLFFH